MAKAPMPGSWQSHHSLKGKDVLGAKAHHEKHHKKKHTHGKGKKRRASGTSPSEGSGITWSSDPNDYKLIAAHTKVVSGMHHHLTVLTNDTATGQPYILNAVVHRDTSGRYAVVKEHPPQKPNNQNDRSSSMQIGTILAITGGCFCFIVLALAGFLWARRRAASHKSSSASNYDDDSDNGISDNQRERNNSQETSLEMDHTSLSAAAELAAMHVVFEEKPPLPTMEPTNWVVSDAPKSDARPRARSADGVEGLRQRAPSQERSPSSTLLIGTATEGIPNKTTMV
jgi:hypothetical protein